MPNTRSAAKALRQSKKRRAKNLAKKTKYKNEIKEFKRLLAAGDIDGAKKLLPMVYRKIDKTAKAGVIKKNKAARLKSKASRALAATAAK